MKKLFLFFIYFTNDSSTDVAGYFIMNTTMPQMTVQKIYEIAGITDGQILMTWINSNTNLTFLQEAIMEYHVHVQKSIGAVSLQVYLEMYKRNATGTETLICTSELSDALPLGTTQEIHLHAIHNDTILNVSDKLVVKMKANGGGGLDNLQIYTENGTASRLELPVPVFSLQGIQGIQGYNGTVDYTNLALTNVSQTLIGNQTIIGNVTLSGAMYWFAGLFNIFKSIFGLGSSTNEILFNGSTIAFNQTYNNGTISNLANLTINQYLTSANTSYLDRSNLSYQSYNTSANLEQLAKGTNLTLYNLTTIYENVTYFINATGGGRYSLDDLNRSGGGTGMDYTNLALKNQSNTFAGNITAENVTARNVSISGALYFVNNFIDNLIAGVVRIFGNLRVEGSLNVSGRLFINNATELSAISTCSAGQVSFYNGTGFKCVTDATGVGGGGSITNRTTRDYYTRNSTQYNQSVITIPVTANYNYTVYCDIETASNGTVNGVQLNLTFPSDALYTSFTIRNYTTTIANSVTNCRNVSRNCLHSSGTSSLYPNFLPQLINGVIENGATSGNFQILMKSEQVNSNSTVGRGSYCSLTSVS